MFTIVQRCVLSIFVNSFTDLNDLIFSRLSTCFTDVQCFVKDVNMNKNKAEIVKTLLFLAKCLGLKVIAEGIETIEEYKFLQQHQCDYGQGYFMSRPVSNDEIFELFMKKI